MDKLNEAITRQAEHELQRHIRDEKHIGAVNYEYWEHSFDVYSADIDGTQYPALRYVGKQKQRRPGD